MIDHDKNVGEVLEALDELGIADNTLVMYRTDNGPHMNTWPDGAHDAVPQREELELGRCVPGAAHGPLAGQDQAGHGVERDRQPHGLAADHPGRGRRATISRRSCSKRLRGGRQDVQGPSRRLQHAAVSDGQGGEEPAQGVLLLHGRRRTGRACVTTTGRWCSWSSAATARCRCGRSRSRSCACRRSSICALDPYEHADVTSNTYYDWVIDHVVPARTCAGFRREVPGVVQVSSRRGRRRPASTIDQVMEKLTQGLGK